MLEYLKTRQNMDLVLDLSSLRRIGEICNDLRFRLNGGVQELLFESPLEIGPTPLSDVDGCSRLEWFRQDLDEETVTLRTGLAVCPGGRRTL